MLVSARHWVGRVLRLAFAVMALGWLAFFRPSSLGGSTSYVIVTGESMTPTFAPGDLVITQPADAYLPGMIVVYRIPAGEPGAGDLIVHRIVGGAAGTGFTTQGDHNAYTDIWHPRASDIAGVPLLLVPGAGVAISILRQPILAAAIATLVVLSVLWPGRRPRVVPAKAPAA